MKTLLGLSLALNLVLGIMIYLRGQKPEVTEAELPKKSQKTFNVQDKRPQNLTKESPTPVPKSFETRGHEVAETADLTSPHLQSEIEVMVEQIANDRDTFLVEELGLNQSVLEKIELIKSKYSKKASEIIQSSGHSMPTLEQRRAFLDVEEQKSAEIAKVMGKKKWQAFQEYMQKYNARMTKKQSETLGVIIPMDI